MSWKGDCPVLALSEFESSNGPSAPPPAAAPRGGISKLAVACILVGGACFYRGPELRRAMDQLLGSRSRPAVSGAAGMPQAAPNAPLPVAPRGAAAPAAPVGAIVPGDHPAPAANAATSDGTTPLPVCIAVMPGASPRPLAYFQEADGVRLRGPGEKTGAWTFLSATPQGAVVRPNDGADARGAAGQIVPAAQLPEIVYTGMMQFGKNRMATFANVSSTVGIGQQVHGATVLALTETSAKIEYQGRRFDLPKAIDRPDLAFQEMLKPRQITIPQPVRRYTNYSYSQPVQVAQPAAQPEPPAAPPKDKWVELQEQNRERMHNGPSMQCRHCSQQLAADTFICPYCRGIARNF